MKAIFGSNWPASALAAVILPAAGLAVYASDIRLFTGSHMHEAYHSQPAVVQNSYAQAMRIYSSSMLPWGSAVAPPLIASQESTIPWVWISQDDGGSIEQRQDGSFVIHGASEAASFFTSTRCQVDEWPALACGDNQSRTISVPDLETLVIGGRIYKRTLPEPKED